MLVLTGDSLGERQKELNTKVNEAVSSKVNFDDVKTQKENSDVDRLFKIDLASKYRNVEYVLEVLKCGDSLYISRALKCIWLYEDGYSNVINPDYLHDNIFPFMSMKMKSKVLHTLSIHVQNERAVAFFRYCMKEKLYDIALKYLAFTPDSLKLEVINERKTRLMISQKQKNYVERLIGNSFDLAETYLQEAHTEINTLSTLHNLRYLFSVSHDKYLDLLEKYGDVQSHMNSFSPQFGLRMSKDIMKKHKPRVLNNPALYLKLVHKKMLVKHSTSDDAKLYASVLIPKECSAFWNNNFYGTHKDIIDLIPGEERYLFLKKMFTDIYPKEEFEMSEHFYNLGYYSLMTAEEREIWALRNIEIGSGLLGNGKDFLWYKFVNFDKALVAIKKYVMIATNGDERAQMLTVLVECAKSPKELENLFNYYYERHVNEKQHLKERFIDAVLDIHDVFSFDYDCWAALNRLFYSLEVYNDSGNYSSKTEYRMISLIYNIINRKDIPEALKAFIDSGIYFYLFKTQTEKLGKEKEEIVYQHMLNFYLETFEKEIKKENYDDEAKETIRKYIHYVLDILFQYDKLKKDIPEIIEKYVMMDLDEFKNHLLLREAESEITEDILFRLLKNKASLTVSKLPDVKEKLEHSYDTFRLNKLLNKLKVYFSNDIAKTYLDFFKNLLSKSKLTNKIANSAVFGILQLADQGFKIEFLTKYAPTNSKIDHSKMNRKLLYIQEGICSLACYSRPPVPLSITQLYIKGGYVHSCLPLFTSYLATLPLPLCIEFVKSIIDSPLSIQKHGIRLAFQCFSVENLKKLIYEVWNKTKNVSLRSVIYKSLYNKIMKEDTLAQTSLFEALQTLTLDLHEDDDKDIFSLIKRNDLPNNFKPKYLETVWKMINKTAKKQTHIEHRTNVIDIIGNHLSIMSKQFIESIIDEHLKSALDETQLNVLYGNNSDNSLVTAKWLLTAKYIMYTDMQEETEKKLEITRTIISKCFKMWDTVHGGIYVARKLFHGFINDLMSCKGWDCNNASHNNLILEQVLKDLQVALPEEEIYDTIWDLRLNIIYCTVLNNRIQKIDDVKPEIIEEAYMEFGKEVVNLLNELIEKRMFYMSFLDDMQSKLVNCIESLLCRLNPCEKCKFDINDAHVLICAEVIVANVFEHYMLAAKLLPQEYSDSNRYMEKYTTVINNIKSFDNKEIQIFMYKKFVMSDNYRHREFM